MAPMPTARHGFGAAVVDGNVYVISGGPTPGGSCSNLNEIFIPPVSAKPVKTSRTPAQYVGSVMAVLATFNDAGVLPPESSVQANQLIRALIQFQTVFVKSPEPAVREFLSSALIAQTGEQATMVLDSFTLTGWTSQSLEAVVDYSRQYPMWENPQIENAFRAYNLSPEDWELVQTLFVKARQNLAHREKDLHAVFASHRSGMPGGNF